MNYIIEGGIDFYSEINKKEENSINTIYYLVKLN